MSSKFEILVKQNELRPEVAKQLYDVLSMCDIVLVCDDSSSMAATIAEDSNPNAKKTTRWMELKKLASVLIEFVTSVNPDGLDLYFLNRGVYPNIKEMIGLQALFQLDPSGSTPLLSTLKKIYKDKSSSSSSSTRQLLIIVVTDGEPSDGSLEQLSSVLLNKRNNVHISFAECTDNEEAMRFLDDLDNKIPNFDNTDDYREEQRRVKAAQGPGFKFDYTDYVIKILLATFVKWYFNLDQKNIQSPNSQQSNRTGITNNNNNGCCTIL
jgi:hypothetical protein